MGRYQYPTGIFLLFTPCLWGTALGASMLGLPPVAAIPTSLLFLFGAFNLRSAGCAINDMFDKDFDKNVERCKNRPLASGVLNPKEAMGFTTAHLLGGLFVLSQLNPTATLLSLGIFPVACLYPLAKRYTHYAQVVLGLCFNSGIFIGAA